MTSVSQNARKAAKARAAKMTPEQRSAHAKMMVEAREAKRKARKNISGTDNAEEQTMNAV